MRIALIARGCRPGAGIERYTFEVAARLSERHEVSVLTNPAEFEPCGHAALVPVRVASKPLWHSILNFSHKAGFAAHAGNYDLVHTQGSDGTWGDVVTAHSCHHAGMRASLKLQPTWMNRLRKTLSPAHRAILTLEQGVFTSAQQLVAVSERVKRQVRATYPLTRRVPMEVIYPGVELADLGKGLTPEERGKIRAQWGIRPNQVALTLVANALLLKGATRLIRALAKVRDRNLVVLLATSSGPDKALQVLARRQGVAPRIIFLSVGKNIQPVLSAADGYVLLPEYESFGLTVLEAAAARLPLLLAQNVGAAELFRNGKDAMLLPARADAETLARAMDTLASQPARRRQLAVAARRVAETYSWDATVRSLETVYARVRKAQSGARPGKHA
jgi:glycosyltransferase involved in cell wall biosynthesis